MLFRGEANLGFEVFGMLEAGGQRRHRHRAVGEGGVPEQGADRVKKWAGGQFDPPAFRKPAVAPHEAFQHALVHAKHRRLVLLGEAAALEF